MTVQRWEQDRLPAPTRDVVDGWASQVAAVAKLAAVIAGTDFVPRGYRGSDTAVTAAILFGREIGIGPITALQGIYVVNGQVAMRAQLMRSLVLARGHHLHIGEWNNATCSMVGRRVGDTEDTVVTWTTEDARRARLLNNPAWTAYPRSMLLARATGELCRAVFADVIGGMTLTTEEAEDLPPAQVDDHRPTRTVRRREPKTPPPVSGPPAPDPGTVPDAPRPSAAPPHPATGELPPLPEDTMAETGPAPAQNGPQAAERPMADQPSTPDPDGPLSSAQRGEVFRLLGVHGRFGTHDERVRVLSGLIGRRVVTTNELTRAEASRAIDQLAMATTSGDPAALDVLVDTGWERISDREDPPLWRDDAELEGTQE